MNMQKNCDLELRLSSTSYEHSDSDTSAIESTSSGNKQQLKEEESQRITIFYNGKMCISSNVTQLQAKSIFSMARRESEEKSSSDGSEPPNRLTQLQRHHNQIPNPKASMKRSLQSFLQKRKNRIQATSPYHHSQK